MPYRCKVYYFSRFAHLFTFTSSCISSLIPAKLKCNGVLHQKRLSCLKPKCGSWGKLLWIFLLLYLSTSNFRTLNLKGVYAVSVHTIFSSAFAQVYKLSEKSGNTGKRSADIWRWFTVSVVFFYLSSLPVAHLSDAPRRRLVVTGDSARNPTGRNYWGELWTFRTITISYQSFRTIGLVISYHEITISYHRIGHFVPWYHHFVPYKCSFCILSSPRKYIWKIENNSRTSK